MKAEIISVGSSLLTGRAVNENAAFLTRELTALGITIAEAVMIAEEPEKLTKTLKRAERTWISSSLPGDSALTLTIA